MVVGLLLEMCLPGQAIHLSAQDSQRSLGGGQFFGGGGNDQLGIAVLGQSRNVAARAKRYFSLSRKNA